MGGMRNLYNSGISMRTLLTLLAVGGLTAAAQAPSAVAIRNAKVVTVSGPALTRGTVVLRNGLIEAVGENITVPADAYVVDGESLTVYPGLIDGLSNWGLPAARAPLAPGGRGGRGGGAQRVAPATAPGTPPPPPAKGPEDRPATTSWIKAADELQANDRRFEQARNAGFTSAATFPMRGIFCGQGSFINLAGDKPGDMVLIPSLGQFLTLSPSGNGFPMALFGTIAYIRQIYLDAGHYTLARDAYARDPRSGPRPEYDRALEGVLESPRILLPANRVVEVDRMLRFAAELKRPAVLYGLREGYRSADLLKKAGATVLVSLKWPEKDREVDPDEPEAYRVLEVRDKAPSTPAELRKAGIKFALYSDGLDQARDLLRAIKTAIDAGLAREDAVRALTLSPAEIYGVADRLGSIEKGKIANLLVTRGEIFDDRTKVEMVFIDGKRFIPAPEAAPAKPAPSGNQAQ